MLSSILLVDDNATDILLVKEALEDLEFDVVVHVAHDGLEAIKMAREIIPDLILMDIMMPKMGGIEALVEIRKLFPKGGMKIVILTTSGDERDTDAALLNEADGFVAKPVEASANYESKILAIKSIFHEEEFEFVIFNK